MVIQHCQASCTLWLDIAAGAWASRVKNLLWGSACIWYFQAVTTASKWLEMCCPFFRQSWVKVYNPDFSTRHPKIIPAIACGPRLLGFWADEIWKSPIQDATVCSCANLSSLICHRYTQAMWRPAYIWRWFLLVLTWSFEKPLVGFWNCRLWGTIVYPEVLCYLSKPFKTSLTFKMIWHTQHAQLYAS